MDIQTLIDKGEALKNVRYDDPEVDLWENDVKAVVAPYGEATQKILEKSLWYGQMIASDEHGQHMHQNAITKVQKLLTELQKRSANDSAAQSAIILQKKAEAKASLGSKFGKTTFNGPVTFGDNSPANSIQVSELVFAIISEAEDKLPDGPEKADILTKLKDIASNPTFAAIAGASLPEIIKRLFV